MRWRAYGNFAFGQHSNPVANAEKRIEIVGDHHHRHAKGFIQLPDELIDSVRSSRIEPGSRFVE